MIARSSQDSQTKRVKALRLEAGTAADEILLGNLMDVFLKDGPGSEIAIKHNPNNPRTVVWTSDCHGQKLNEGETT